MARKIAMHWIDGKCDGWDATMVVVDGWCLLLSAKKKKVEGGESERKEVRSAERSFVFFFSLSSFSRAK